MLKLLRLLKPHRTAIAAVLGLLFLQAMADLSLPNLLADIVNNGIASGDVRYILRMGGLMVLIALFGIACSAAGNYLSSGVAFAFGRGLRARVFARVESFSPAEFDRAGTASLITRTTNDVTQVQQSVTLMLSMMVRAPIMCVGGIIMAAERDARLSLVFAAAVPALGLIIAAVMRYALPLFRLIQSRLDGLNLVLREKLSGIRVVRAFGREERERRRFEGASSELLDTSLELASVMAALGPAMMIVMNFTLIAVLWFGSLRVAAGGMRVGDVMAFTQYLMQILFALIMLSMLFIVIPRSQASADRINEVLETEPGIKDPEDPAPSPERRGLVEFRDVSFRYHGAERDAVSGVSFKAGPGELTAVIGGTGSGKSTLAGLVPRFYDAVSGSVLVDGADVRGLTQKDLRSRIGFVPQKATLFTGTVADNVRFGSDGLGEAAVREAAAVAQAEGFVSAMKDGFSSAVSQGGVNLSGGQKQRLAIARAVARKPDIYIFDDSFSALDFRTEAALRAALRKETGGSTVIMVAQRVTSVRDADRIVVLDEGRVAGIGRHRELLETCAVYREIAYSQLSREELE